MYHTFSAIFVATSCLFALATLLLGMKQTIGQKWSDRTERLFIFFFSLGAIILAQLYQNHPVIDAAIAIIFLNMLVAAISFKFKNYTPIGIFFYTSNMLLAITGIPWGFAFVLSTEMSPLSKLLMLITSPLLFLTLPFGFVQMVEQFDVLCRKNWTRPREEKIRQPKNKLPMVSLHIPTYAEPPEMVIETLNKVAALEYDNFEVILIDNNTKDENLWKPVRAHCEKLGKHFRFFHIDPLSGAKAGALNFALAQTSKKAEVIGVIDADYHPNPDFISNLIGHFEDPRIGFVQTPHDYRDWEDSAYLTMCYWEYKAFFHTILVALNERDAALTIGTMCLLRKKAVEEAGGWATWCVTEDSEMAIRIHDVGYLSVYVPVSYGKGLIPERFSDYTKQRNRWIAGPVQELRHHFRHFIGVDGKPSSFTFLQRLHHFHHGYGSAMFGLNIPFIVLSEALALSMAFHEEIIPVPFPLWISITTLLVTNIFLLWIQYRTILNASVTEMLMGILANKSLSFTANSAAFNALINTTQKWRRTNKFKVEQSFGSALLSTYPEILIGISLLMFAFIVYDKRPYQGLLTMCLLGIVYKGFDHLAAPIVAVIATRSRQKKYEKDSASVSHASLKQTESVLIS